MNIQRLLKAGDDLWLQESEWRRVVSVAGSWVLYRWLRHQMPGRPHVSGTQPLQERGTDLCILNNHYLFFSQAHPYKDKISNSSSSESKKRSRRSESEKSAKNKSSILRITINVLQCENIYFTVSNFTLIQQGRLPQQHGLTRSEINGFSAD